MHMDFMSIAQELKAKRQDILQLAARHGATQVRIFGSVARAEAGPDSDVDFLVKLAPERSLLDHVALWQDLEDLLGRKVDVVSEKALHRLIRDQVLKEAVPL
jgi:predicted nucleotidyltransferase